MRKGLRATSQLRIHGEEKPIVDGTVILRPKDKIWDQTIVVDDKDTFDDDTDDEVHVACSGVIDSLDKYKEPFGFDDNDEIHPFQLFLQRDQEYEMMINARWPNAVWQDPMLPPKWEEHAHITNRFAEEGVPKVFYNDF